jgi:SHS2 domain-containing protein
MSSWLWPTTADVGMRIFAPTLSTLLSEASHGMQHYLMSPSAAATLNQHLRSTGEWRVRARHNPQEPAFLFLSWLDEVLYRAEVHEQWLVDALVQITEDEQGLLAIVQASWVDARLVEREIEIKAVTTHNLVVDEVEPHQTIQSQWEDVPDFDGPGWYADVVFDI